MNHLAREMEIRHHMGPNHLVEGLSIGCCLSNHKRNDLSILALLWMHIGLYHSYGLHPYWEDVNRFPIHCHTVSI